MLLRKKTDHHATTSSSGTQLSNDEVGISSSAKRVANSQLERPAWHVELKPSAIHRMLLGLLTGTATSAVILTPMYLPLQLMVSIAILTGGLLQIKMLCKIRRLAHFKDIDNRNPDLPGGTTPREYWSVTYDATNTVTGKLITAGYRSANLLVLVLQTESGRWHRIPVWTDALPASQFSYLNCQMTYNTTAPCSRLLALLGTCRIALRLCLNYTCLSLKKLSPNDYR